MKMAVVVGGAGFIGGALCKRLQEKNYNVISLDNYFTGSDKTHVPKVEYRRGHSKNILAIIPEKPDIIFHLGEYSRTEISLSEPNLVWDLNIAGTFGVLEYWRVNKCKLVYAGSSTKFADGGLGRDQSPYAWTKASNSELVCNYARWYTLPYAITYFYNVYGPGERSGKYGTLIEIFKQKSIKGEMLAVTSPGTQRRIFTHVDDIVDGLMLVAERGEGDEFGLGSGDAFSILEVAELFGGKIIMKPERAGNRMSAVLDTTKAKALGWTAKRSLRDYIRTVNKNISKW